MMLRTTPTLRHQVCHRVASLALCAESACGQRIAYHITKIVNADDVVARVVYWLIAGQIRFAEDRRRAIKRFIQVDELDCLSLGIENGAYGTRAVIFLYVCRDADIIGPALNTDRGGAADFPSRSGQPT